MTYVVFVETEEPMEGFPVAVTVRPSAAEPLIAIMRVFLNEGIAMVGLTNDELNTRIAAFKTA